jgi:hypothetical protein
MLIIPHNKTLQPCKPSTGYTIKRWSNQYGKGCRAVYTSSSLHARINRRAGLSVAGI